MSTFSLSPNPDVTCMYWKNSFWKVEIIWQRKIMHDNHNITEGSLSHISSKQKLMTVGMTLCWHVYLLKKWKFSLGNDSMTLLNESIGKVPSIFLFSKCAGTPYPTSLPHHISVHFSWTKNHSPSVQTWRSWHTSFQEQRLCKPQLKSGKCKSELRFQFPPPTNYTGCRRLFSQCLKNKDN